MLRVMSSRLMHFVGIGSSLNLQIGGEGGEEGGGHGYVKSCILQIND